MWVWSLLGPPALMDTIYTEPKCTLYKLRDLPSYFSTLGLNDSTKNTPMRNIVRFAIIFPIEPLDVKDQSFGLFLGTPRWTTALLTDGTLAIRSALAQSFGFPKSEPTMPMSLLGCIPRWTCILPNHYPRCESGRDDAASLLVISLLRSSGASRIRLV